MDQNEAETLPVSFKEYDYWKHPSGIEVRIVGEGFIKNEDVFQNGNAWIPAVMYRNSSGDDATKIYTRSKESFLKKFKQSN